MGNAAFELELQTMASEERDADMGNVNNWRCKSTPRHKQINILCTKCSHLADCMSFAQINGSSRLARLCVSVKPLSNMVQSNGPFEVLMMGQLLPFLLEQIPFLLRIASSNTS